MKIRTLSTQMRCTGAQIRIQKIVNQALWECDIDVSFDNRNYFTAAYDINKAEGMTQRSLAPTSSQVYTPASVYLFRDDSDPFNPLRAVVFNVWTGSNIANMRVTSFTMSAIDSQFDAMWNIGEDSWPPTCDNISSGLRRKITEFVVHEFVTLKGSSI